MIISFAQKTEEMKVYSPPMLRKRPGSRMPPEVSDPLRAEGSLFWEFLDSAFFEVQPPVSVAVSCKHHGRLPD